MTRRSNYRSTEQDSTTPPANDVTGLSSDDITTAEDHMTKQEKAATLQPDQDHLMSPDSTCPFTRARSATLSGGGRPKIRPRKPKVSPGSHVTLGDDRVASSDDHVTAGVAHVTSDAASMESGPPQAEPQPLSTRKKAAKEKYESRCQVHTGRVWIRNGNIRLCGRAYHNNYFLRAPRTR